MLKILRFLAVAVASAPLLGLSSPAFAQDPAPAAPAAAASAAKDPAPSPGNLNEGYVIGAGDVLEITVLGRDEFRPRVQVQVDGTIQLPYLHSVKAANLTVIQLRDQIGKMLRDGGFYTDPVVNLAVASYASRYVTVLGEFGSPGIVPVDRAYRVSEILARVGGARATASDEIVLRRANGEEFKLLVIDVARGGPDKDPYVEPGDKLYLAMASNFYIYGQVGAPGAYKIENGMTIRMALARGGGVTDRGSAGKISIYRGGQKVKATLDMPLTANDTVYVGERFF
jgi:polysaccharide export outer membrane protein